MISPDEIRKQAEKWWKPFLQSVVNGAVFFPKQLDRIGKIRPGAITAEFETLQKEVALLYQYSKNKNGIGYRVETADRTFRRTGTQQVPNSIVFDTVEDYMHVIGKAKEWKVFRQNLLLILDTNPRLREWVHQNPLSLTSSKTDWGGVLKVCDYFTHNPRPELYIRQLPIAVRTKFIEENAGLIQCLLDYLIPEHVQDGKQKEIAQRYFLKYNEPLVRIRVLDSTLKPFKDITDISIRLSDFEKNDWAAKTVFITENKMNFLTLPPAPATIALWSGGGFNVSYLKGANWLHSKRIFYWGDIDTHGFQILHQIRTYFPQTESIMMDAATFEHFQEYAVKGEISKAENVFLLNPAETALYKSLQSKEKNRLEQEKIPQHYSDSQFERLMSGISS